MVEPISKRTEEKPRETRCVSIVYESPAIRGHAAHFCEKVAEECDITAEFELSWWSFDMLKHSVVAGDAALKAARADLIIFALDARGDLPHEVKLWIENWLGKRGEREGALVGLLQREGGPADIASFREIYLRHVARRAGMDYLSHSAPTVARAIPDSIDSFNERAGRMTSVLDNILHTHPPTMPML